MMQRVGHRGAPVTTMASIRGILPGSYQNRMVWQLTGALWWVICPTVWRIKKCRVNVSITKRYVSSDRCNGLQVVFCVYHLENGRTECVLHRVVWQGYKGEMNYMRYSCLTIGRLKWSCRMCLPAYHCMNSFIMMSCNTISGFCFCSLVCI